MRDALKIQTLKSKHQKSGMYNHLEAKLHDVFWETEGSAAELPLLEKFLENHSGTTLELGCGSGRLMLPLLKNGFLLEGLDNSEDMLELCAEKCIQYQPVLHHADMLDFSTGTTYSAITLPAFTLQFTPPEKLPELLTNIHQHLHPGGGLYITTFIPWAEITGELEEGEWFPDQDTELHDGNIARCHTRFQVERMSQRLTRDHRYEIVTSDHQLLESSESTHHLNWFWPNELSRILNSAGFTVDRLISDFNSTSSFDENSQIVTFYCSREHD